MGLPSGSAIKNPPGDSGLDLPGSGSGSGNGNPLQYSCPGNSMDRGAWWATGNGVAKGLDVTE